MIWRLALAALLVMAAGEKHSGYQDASPETRAMQDDDASNPGLPVGAAGRGDVG